MVFLLTSFAMGQTEKDTYREASLKFKDYFNAKQHDSIFYMFNAQMREALPLEKANLFFDQMYAEVGELKVLEFFNLKQSAHVYKSTFENGVRDITIYLDGQNKIGGLLVTVHKDANLPKLERNSTKMIWPFNEEAFVFWGGETIAQNYHMAQEVQQYAYDILMVANGTSFMGDPKSNENYFVFGKEIMAPCDAKVVKIISGVHDNVPGELNPKQLTGNTVVLETPNKEYILFAHLKEKSILVKEGDSVVQGQTIAQCGNSGNSTEAHLHLQLQNVPDFFQATGAKLYFDEIWVNGVLKRDYIPVKEDFVKNIDKNNNPNK